MVFFVSSKRRVAAHVAEYRLQKQVKYLHCLARPLDVIAPSGPQVLEMLFLSNVQRLSS